MEAHNAAVQTISARVAHFHTTKQPFRNYHGTSLSTRPSHRTAANIVDTSSLHHVLSVDTTTRTAMVEPNVAMDALVEATLAKGLVPRVVMEFPSITVGGGFSGSAGESSSFRFGLFEATIDWIEIVLPNGEVTRAGRNDEKRDLFWGAASAFGTMGVVTLLQVQLMEAKKYVALTYSLTETFVKTLDEIRAETAKTDVDYVDGIMFTKDLTLTCSGRLVDDLPADERPVRFSRRKDPWFYTRAWRVFSQISKKPGATVTDYVPLVDYLFRYDRGGFWTAKDAFKYFKVPFNRVTRYLLDSFMYTRVLNTAQAKTDFAYHFMIQDCGIPFANCEEFKTWLDANVKIYPIWLCPLRPRRDSPDSSHGIHAAMGQPDYPDLLNFGIWGFNSWDAAQAFQRNRALETKVKELGGWKTLYAHAYYTEDEFWEVYDRDSYNVVREKYGSAYLPTVYDKVEVKGGPPEYADAKARRKARIRSTWPLRGLVGVFHAIKGGDVLLQKK